MKILRTLLLCLSLLVTFQSCKTEFEPRPLVDINTLAGKWASAGYEFAFDPATHSGLFTKVPAGNAFGFKVGDVRFKNVEAVDATTFRGESLYRSASGYYLFADIKITVSGDVLTYTSDAGRSNSSLAVTGQTGTYNRVK